ncbi:MAG: aminoacyl-tRNA hydrolase [Leptospiraceae bacterium]|nr:aminoacyl-tRNA hydrolase [Leptospiraceae bacterium]MCP5497653.1 aminoacyl-tRNA hydrolase [Leptospiraceae bacterium]
MKLLIVGLGNPGVKYEGTRHSIGFRLVDRFVDSKGVTFSNDKKCPLAKFFLEDKQIYVLKPFEFMNLSGNCVSQVLRANGIQPENMLVVHDEIDFPFEKIKIKIAGGHAGHNGLKDIVSRIGTPNFYRLRVGVGRPPQGDDVADYVLSKFNGEENKKLPEIQTKVQDMILQWILERQKEINQKTK